MPGVIDPETMNVDSLPGIWSPVQWELTEEERLKELHDQATASLLWAIDVPEALLRLLLYECDIERALDAPEGYDSVMQGEWDASLVTFKFQRALRLNKIERDRDYLYVEYDFENRGVWSIEIEPEKVTIERL